MDLVSIIQKDIQDENGNFSLEKCKQNFEEIKYIKEKLELHIFENNEFDNSIKENLYEKMKCLDRINLTQIQSEKLFEFLSRNCSGNLDSNRILNMDNEISNMINMLCSLKAGGNKRKRTNKRKSSNKRKRSNKCKGTNKRKRSNKRGGGFQERMKQLQEGLDRQINKIDPFAGLQERGEEQQIAMNRFHNENRAQIEAGFKNWKKIDKIVNSNEFVAAFSVVCLLGILYAYKDFIFQNY
jgi:hypothetical protein